MTEQGERDAKVAHIVGLVLGKTLAPTDTIEKATEPAWDSMRHIEIIMTVEQELGIAFAPEDIPFLTSLSAIIAKVNTMPC